METMMAQAGTAAARYNSLLTDRERFLTSARRSALLTIPSLLPPQGFSSGDELYKPYQGIGARGVNNLASKLLIALAPPNAPFFRLKVAQHLVERLEQDAGFKTEIEKALSKMEREIMASVDATGDRVVFFEALKHLIVAGNVLLYITKDGVKAFHLDRYVVKRDAMGTPVEIVVKESFDRETLPENVKGLIAGSEAGNPSVPSSADKNIDVYTHVIRKQNQWYVYQEVVGQKVPDSDGQYPLDRCPWMPLRLVRIDGEDYGRGYVEEYIGDLISLESLSQAVVEATVAAAKLIFLVKPNGTTSEKTIAEAENLAVVEGNEEDVGTLQSQKAVDLRVARETMNKIEERLYFAFLLNSAVQRQAERVTAEEIRFMAQELEDALGGVYSLLSQEFQLPYVNRKIAILQKAGDIRRLPKGAVRPVIVTGLEALGRGHDRNRLVSWLSTLTQALGPEQVIKRVNVNEVIERLALADGIDTEGLLVDPQVVAQQDQNAQMMALANRVAPEAMKQAGQAVTQPQGNPNVQQ